MPQHYKSALHQLLEPTGFVLFALFIFFASFALSDIAPYDFIAIPTILLWFALGIRLHKEAMPFVMLIVVFTCAQFISLIPYIHEPLPTIWTIQSLYLTITAIFFVMFFSDETKKRVELALKAYMWSCIVAATLGIVGYFNIAGTEGLFARYGRASGTFQDPNVLGSFLVLGALYLIHNLLTGREKYPFLSFVYLIIILTGIFLSFSRGSWGGIVVSVALLSFMAFRTSRLPYMRKRISSIFILTVFGGCIAVAGLLSVPEVAEKFSDRATVTKDYDQGETGRFGNQLRSLPMLLERPNGFGPLRFRLWFQLEPHNSYIGGFANGGWLGGFSFIALVLITCFVGFRLCFSPSPYQRPAQIVWPALFIFFLQAFQIDIEHWRHVYMMWGMIWALEVARVRYVKQHTLERRQNMVPNATLVTSQA